MKTLAILSLAAIGALAASVLACGPHHEGLDASRVPEKLRADYDLFARRCSKCHSLARPLSAGFTEDEQWTRYVTRMRRQPGSGISPDEQERILRFLYWYASDLRAQKAAKESRPQGAPDPAAPAPAPASAPGPAPAPAPSAGPAPAPAPVPGIDGGAS